MSLTLRERIQEVWSEQGECRSCGWHAALYEYADEDFVVDGPVVHMPCLNSDVDDAYTHRGVRVTLPPEAP